MDHAIEQELREAGRGHLTEGGALHAIDQGDFALDAARDNGLLPASPVDTERAAYIDGLRQVADFLDQHPDVPVTAHESFMQLVPSYTDDAAAVFARAVKALASAGRVEKNDSGSYFTCTVMVGGHELSVFTDRTVVCERVVVGTEIVEIPDPAAPKITVEQEIVEWRCGSILAAAAGGE